MIKKLFGETEDIQLAYLQKKIKITVILLAITVIGLILREKIEWIGIIAEGLPAIIAYVWGWSFMSAFFGITTFGTIFAGNRNLMVGLLILLAYMCIGYFFGAIALLLGICRFIQLKTKQVKMRKEAQQQEYFSGTDKE